MLKDFYTKEEFAKKGEHTKVFENFTTFNTKEDFIKTNRSKSEWKGQGVYLDKDL